MGSRGFTLIEVLIALAITALVSALAYQSLSAVMQGAESNERNARRVYEINRTLAIIGRDIEQFALRPVTDEFGELEPALQGGQVARFPLSLTRGGWHNPTGLPRSYLQRVNYRIEDDTLWRDSYPVLDRATDTVPQSARLLAGVTALDVLFLPSLDALQPGSSGTTIDTRAWPENWVPDPSTGQRDLAPPQALELRLQLEDWGELRQLYVLPPL